jgi:hypothetical protein
MTPPKNQTGQDSESKLTLPEITIEGDARDAGPLPSPSELTRSIYSGLSADDQRAGRTNDEIISRLENATGLKGVSALGFSAGMGPLGSHVKNDSAMVTQLEAHFIERGVVSPVHTGTAEGKGKLDALEAGLAKRDPLAQKTAALIAGRIHKYVPGRGGSFTYSGKPGELADIGNALHLMPKEQERLAAIVRRTFPKDRPLTIDDSGNMGSAQELAAQEAYEKFEIVSKAGTTMGSILAGMTGMAGGSVRQMKASAQMGDMLEASAALLAEKGSASKAA